jgi:hypothetical protein
MSFNEISSKPTRGYFLGKKKVSGLQDAQDSLYLHAKYTPAAKNLSDDTDSDGSCSPEVTHHNTHPKSPRYTQRRPPRLQFTAENGFDPETITQLDSPAVGAAPQSAGKFDSDSDSGSQFSSVKADSGNSKKFCENSADYFDLSGLNPLTMTLTVARTAAAALSQFSAFDVPIASASQAPHHPAAVDASPSRECDASFGRHQDRRCSRNKDVCSTQSTTAVQRDSQISFQEYSRLWEVLQGLPTGSIIHEHDFYERITKGLLMLPLHFNRLIMMRVNELYAIKNKKSPSSSMRSAAAMGPLEVNVLALAHFWDQEITKYDEIELLFRLLKRPMKQGLTADDLFPLIQRMIETCPNIYRKVSLFTKRLSLQEKESFKYKYVSLVVRRILEQVNLLRNGEISLGEFKRSNLWACLVLEHQV